MQRASKIPSSSYFLIAIVAIFLSVFAVASAVTGPAATSPLFFIENQGQYDQSVLYRTQANGATLWFTETGIVYQFARVTNPSNEGEVLTTGMSQFGHPSARGLQVEYQTVTMQIVGANPIRQAVAEGEEEYAASFFIGNDSDLWKTNVPVRTELTFAEVYPGIDLKYYGNLGSLEYDFVLAPGKDASQIRLQYSGVKSLTTNESGELVIETNWGTMKEKRPRVYQEIDGRAQEAVGEYVIYGEREYGFRFSGTIDRRHPVVIDPVVTFSTYLGGTSYEESWGLAVDNSGYIYVTGLTASTDFPTEPDQDPIFPVDVFVSKLSPDGQNLIYSTFVGGDNYDGATNIAVDAAGNAYVTGETKSTDFPAVNAYQSELGGGSDAFVFRLKADGTALDYSTYLGGTNGELGRAIAAGPGGDAVVIGSTCSDDFPMENALQATYGGDGPSILHCGDAFVAKFAPTGGAPVFSTYLGGSSYDEGWGIDIDAEENAYAVGLTASTDFPTLNPIYTPATLVDAFLVKIKADGQSMVYGTFLGGDNYDGATSVAVDRWGNAYVAGETKSTDLPKSNPAISSLAGMSDAFVMKVNAAGSELAYSYYVGGLSYELAWDIDVDAFGGPTIVGYTYSDDFDLAMPIQAALNNSADIFVTHLAPSGSLITFSSYYGGTGDEIARSVSVHKGRSILFTGTTVSEDFPVENAYQPDYAGGSLFPRGDAVIASLVVTYACGDFNGSGGVNASDVVTLLQFIFLHGAAPIDDAGGDVNCDGRTTISDAVYMIKYMFLGGPGPCSNCAE